MARSWSSRWKYGVLAGAFSLQTGCHSLNVQMNSCEDGNCAAPLAHREPKVNGDPSMMSLATDLDHLEKHIDWYGSVTVKSPDIWGQQRLTRYREEFEKEMVEELGDFVLTLSGSQARSDQAYAAFAMSMGVAIQPPAVPPAGPKSPSYLEKDPTLVKTKVVEEEKKVDGGTTTTKTTTNEPVPLTPPPPPTKIEAPAAVDPTGLVDKDPNFTRNAAKLERIGFEAKLKANGIGLEPTEFLNQKQRYLNHLSQIRRNNEGDDTADSPGYSLNLIRLPVSVLPGKRTDVGHGAEVTMTIEPVLTQELLPSVFRNFVMNDLTKELGFPLTKYLDGDSRGLLTEKNRILVRYYNTFEKIVELYVAKDCDPNIVALFMTLPEDIRQAIDLPSDEKENQRRLYAQSELLRRSYGIKDAESKRIRRLALSAQSPDQLTTMAIGIIPDPKISQAKQLYGEGQKNNASGSTDSPSSPNSDCQQIAKIAQLAKDSLAGLKKSSLSNYPFSTGTRNKQAIPFSQFFEIHGAAFPFEIAFQANRALGQTIKEQGYAHLPDVQAFLAQELDAAYRLLKDPNNHDLWQRFCSTHLVSMIRARNVEWLDSERGQFRDMIFAKAQVAKDEGDPDRQSQFSCTAACAWAIIVQSALLNDRLMLDMKETAASQHCEPFCTQEWVDYYLPCPSGTARNAFIEYVKKRWPIKVFALDPMNDEQNVADALSTRREMQLALAVAFKSGNMNGNTFGKFARRLEAEYETIDLNRTQIGFGHGENTFGWRFYPRFQTPPTRSNAYVLLREQIIGGQTKGSLLRQRRLEPGMRECTALVIMPSFVPHVTIETTTNWFGLANPKHKVFDHTQHLHLSRTIKAAQTQGACMTDANCYRDGDDRRLKNRVEQLANRLPMQTLSAQVPLESNVGGHELFIHGTTDLAPELYGWYGAPGVDLSKKSTSLFLVGNHFSVTQSTVLVGNVRITRDKCWMISRQVMRVEIPQEAMAFKQMDGSMAVNVHIATPYGVSREITIPDVSKKPDPAKGLPLNTEAVVKYAKQPTAKKDGLFELASPVVGDAVFVKWSGDTAPDQVTVRFTFMFRDCPLVIDIQTQGAEMKPIKTPIKNVGGVYRIEKSMLDEVLKELFCRVNQFGGLTNETSPLKEGNWSANVTLINKDDPSSKDSTNTLNLKFKCSIP